MNIALPAVLLLAFLLPGALFAKAFNVSEDKTSDDTTPFAAIILASIVFAVMMHSIWVVISTKLLGYTIDINTIFVLLTLHEDGMTKALEVTTASINQIAYYFLTILPISFLMGLGIRHVIITHKLDQGPHFINQMLRTNTPWYYYFKDHDSNNRENPDCVVISIIQTIGNLEFLYIGNLKSYHLNKEGKLDRIVLEYVESYRFALDNNKIKLVSCIVKNPEEFNEEEESNMVFWVNEISNLQVKYGYFGISPI